MEIFLKVSLVAIIILSGIDIGITFKAEKLSLTERVIDVIIDLIVMVCYFIAYCEYTGLAAVSAESLMSKMVIIATIIIIVKVFSIHRIQKMLR